MEKWQKFELINKYPEASGKVFLLGKWHGDKEINDPYRKSKEVYRLVFETIEECCLAWCSRINI